MADKPRFPIPIHNLPPANPDFVGREDVLARLHELLSQGQGPAVLTQAITGLGGVGKTQTALAYCYRHLADHGLVWWLRAERPETLGGQFTLLAPHLGLDPAMPDQAALVAQILDALGRRGGYLLVFDNLEEPAALPAFLPRTGGRVLITARRRDWQGRARALALDVMPEPEALELLTGSKDWVVLPDLAEAKALAEELGHLPLALAQARSYMGETGETLAGYRRLLAESRPAVLAEGRAHPDYPATVARTWDISVRAAEAAEPAARTLLELLAFFAPDPLPRAVLDADPEALPEDLRNKLARNRAIGALNRFSLINANAADGTLTMHRLVQAVTRDGLAPEAARRRVECSTALLNKALPRPPQEHTNWPAIGTLLPHALAVTAEAERLQAGLTAAATVLNNLALYHNARAAWAAAEPLYRRAIAIGEKSLGRHPAILAAALTNLAVLYYDTGRYAEAEPLYLRAIAISDKVLDPNHPDLATRLNNLASLYRVTGRYAEAEALYGRAIAIDVRSLGPEHPESASTLNNLALLYKATGRYAEAEALYLRAITIGEKALGSDHPDFAVWLNNLAELYWAAGLYAEAESLLMRALAIQDKVLPPDHPRHVIGRENYALLLDKLGRGDEAAALRAKAAEVRKMRGE